MFEYSKDFHRQTWRYVEYSREYSQGGVVEIFKGVKGQAEMKRCAWCGWSVHFSYGTRSRSSWCADEGKRLLSAGGAKEDCGSGADGRDDGGALPRFPSDGVRPGSGSDGPHHHPQVGFTLEYSMRSIVRVPMATVRMSGRAMS